MASMSAAGFTLATPLVVGASWQLVEGFFIALSPLVAVALGHQEALLLQHLHFWLNYKAQNSSKYAEHKVQDRYWVYWNYDDLVREIPLGRSVSPHKRAIRHLKRLGILLVEQPRSKAWDQTCYYSIAYDVLAEVLERGQSEAESNGRNALLPAGEKHPPHPDDSAGSNDIDSSDHSTESSASNSSIPTTTKETAHPLNPLDHVGCGGEFDVSELPIEIQSDVLALVADKKDGQRYIDLLIARLQQAAGSPAVGKVNSPLLWLESIIRLGKPDFTAGDEIEKQRRAVTARRVLDEKQLAERQASSAAEDAAREHRHSAAAKVLASLDEDARKALADATRASVMPKKTRACIDEAVHRGVLPDHPYALNVVVTAIERLSADRGSAAKGEQP